MGTTGDNKTARAVREQHNFCTRLDKHAHQQEQMSTTQQAVVHQERITEPRHTSSRTWATTARSVGDYTQVPPQHHATKHERPQDHKL